MIVKVKTLQGYKLHATDGFIGHVDEFFFDDTHWTVRYLVANTGSWLTGRQVLLSPYALVKVDELEKSIIVNLSKKQIEDGPALETDKPISKKFEEEYYEYFEWPMYWSGPETWGYNPYIDRTGKKGEEDQSGTHWDVHLLSTQDMTGHHLHAVDGDIGHVVDFIIDDKTWTITSLVVDTTNWWLGKKVLVSPKSIERVDWGEEKVYVKLTREEVQKLEEPKK